MISKEIKITTQELDDVIRLLNLRDTEYVYNMIEDLSDVIKILDDANCQVGLVGSVATVQKLLIELCRVK